MDPFAVVWDAGATELTRKDASHCFVSEWMTKDKYQREFKTKTLPNEFPSGLTHSQNVLYWNTDERVRVASRWFKVPYKRKLGLLDTGETIDLTALGPNARFLNVVRERDVTAYKIKHQKLSGDAVLSEDEWAGSHIPIIPCIGNEVCVDGRMIRFGVVRWMKDPARLYNYFRSASAELTALQPKAPYLVPFESIQGLENWWTKANTENLPYLPYKLSKDAPNARPTREAPPQPSAALYQETQIADSDMNGTTGIYPAALGQRSNETSGRAIEARKSESDTSTFVYFDNFNQAIGWTGEQCAELIGKIYDGERQIRILGKDEREQTAVINKVVQTPMGPIIINDITQAKFDVRVKTGPSFTTGREQARQALTELVTRNPELMAIVGDIYFDTMDFQGASKLSARFRKTMQPGLVGEDEGGQPAPQPDPMMETVKRIQLAKAQSEIENKQAATVKTKAETAKIMSETHGKAIENEARLHGYAREQYQFENPQEFQTFTQ